VREIVKATGNILTVAGTGTASYNGDNMPATSAMLNQPNGVAVDGSGNVFISDWHNNRIREVVKATGNIITFAGTGTAGFSGNVFLADFNNHRVREVVLTNNPTIGSLSAPTWTVNQPGFSGSATVTGGTAPYSNLSATGLPPGLTAALNGSTITLSGTPTAAGTYSYVTLSVQDAGGNTAGRTFTITINAPPTLGALSPTQWTAGVSGYTGA